jgi:hypothetical protein
LLLKIPFREFRSLPVPERQVVIHAFFLLSIIRLGMWLVPFRTLQRTFDRVFPCPESVTGKSLSSETILSAKKASSKVREVSRYVPSATCLVQALALQAMLSREGIPSDLAIGVARDEKSAFIAHAWLEINGTVIIGGEEQNRYTRLTMQQ